MGVITLHKEDLHDKGSSSLWLYGGVVHSIRHFSCLWFSSESGFSVVQVRIACCIGIRALTNLGVDEIPLKVIYCFKLCRG